MELKRLSLTNLLGDLLHQLTTDCDLDDIAGAPKYQALTDRLRIIVADLDHSPDNTLDHVLGLLDVAEESWGRTDSDAFTGFIGKLEAECRRRSPMASGTMAEKETSAFRDQCLAAPRANPLQRTTMGTPLMCHRVMKPGEEDLLFTVSLNESMVCFAYSLDLHDASLGTVIKVDRDDAPAIERETATWAKTSNPEEAAVTVKHLRNLLRLCGIGG